MVYGLLGDGPPKPGINKLLAEHGVIPMSAITSVDEIETLADEWEGPIHQALIPAALILTLYANNPEIFLNWFEFTRQEVDGAS